MSDDSNQVSCTQKPSAIHLGLYIPTTLINAVRNDG